MAPSGGSGGDTHGPTKGTSLSLMKRLLYSHILYNSVAVGFENGWFEGETLSPIGRIQQAAQRWVKEQGQPGVMYTPVALLLDFHSGWSFPRHLYSGDIFRVWGNLPYDAGDYLTDAVLDLLYPGYADSSYFHDESGFIAPTPYGDIADCLLSDAPAWLLSRYAVIVVTGALAGGREIRDKLQAYVEEGGHLVITAGNLAKLPGGIAGQTEASSIGVTQCGKGKLTVLAADFGIDVKQEAGRRLRSEIDKPLPRPYELRAEARRTLETVFQQQALFEVGSGDLSFITCRQGPGAYLLGVANSTWRELPLKIASLCGPLESIREVPLDRSELEAVGYLPEGVTGESLGRNTDNTIRGGDFRVFAVRVKESGVEVIPHRTPPPRPRGRALPLRRARSVKEEILARPTFFEHFDGIVLDWRYLHEREKSILQQEAGWMGRQGLQVFVDLSSGVNLYPTLAAGGQSGRGLWREHGDGSRRHGQDESPGCPRPDSLPAPVSGEQLQRTPNAGELREDAPQAGRRRGPTRHHPALTHGFGQAALDSGRDGCADGEGGSQEPADRGQHGPVVTGGSVGGRRQSSQGQNRALAGGGVTKG